MIVLSMLIPTTSDRQTFTLRLLEEISNQCGGIKDSYIKEKVNVLVYNNDCEVLIFEDNKEHTIGEKRNVLLDAANGIYIASIDSDDMITKNYIETLLKGIETSPDCISLRGVITWDGGRPEVFEHSIRYKEYKTKKDYRENEPTFIKYERYPNHLNCIKASIAKQFKFPSSNFGEDTDWATQVFNSGLLKNEYYTDNILYQYLYRTNK